MKLLKGLFHVLMDQANAGEGGGAGGGGTGAPDNGNGSAGAAGAAGGGQGNAGSGSDAAGGNGAGATGGNDAATGNALQAGAQGQGDQAFIPEKFQVKKEDGTLDLEASSRKLAETYGHLEKRLGTGDLPPRSPEEYEVKVPDALKDAWNPKEDEKLQAFLKDAHANGYTQKQVDMALAKYLEIAPELVAGSRALSADECVADLKKEWKTDDQYKAEVGKAYKAAVAYGDADAEGIIKDYGNDPRIVRMLARIGGELSEDKSPNPGGAAQTSDTIQGLMASEAYTNPKHPDHARVSAQVQQHYARQAEAAAKSGAVPLL